MNDLLSLTFESFQSSVQTSQKLLMKMSNINSDDLLKTFFCQPSTLFIHSVDLTVGKKRCGNRPLGHLGSYTVGFVSGNHHLETPKPTPDSFVSLGSKMSRRNIKKKWVHYVCAVTIHQLNVI